MGIPHHTYKPGLNSVGSYQVSGRPWLTGSAILSGALDGNGEKHIVFPSVTKSFTVINRGANAIRIHFDSHTNPNVYSQRHYISLPNQDDSFGFDVKCKEVYITLADSTASPSDFEIHAELTGISPQDMHALTGSGINSWFDKD